MGRAFFVKPAKSIPSQVVSHSERGVKRSVVLVPEQAADCLLRLAKSNSFGRGLSQ